MSEGLSLQLRPISLDCFAELRHMHSQAFRAYLGPELGEDQLDALVEFVNTPAYTQHVLKSECFGAWIDNRLCATASWLCGKGAAASAKLTGVCVDPLFGSLGLAWRLLDEFEARAHRAGYLELSAQSPVSMTPFFEELGYKRSSRGIWAMPCGVSIPVVHLQKRPNDETTIGHGRGLVHQALKLATFSWSH